MKDPLLVDPRVLGAGVMTVNCHDDAPAGWCPRLQQLLQQASPARKHRTGLEEKTATLLVVADRTARSRLNARTHLHLHL